MLLVTGITGHTGRYFLQELIKNQYPGSIRCIVRENSDTSLIDNSGLKIEKVFGDISDEVFLDKCMKDVETVFHIVNIRYTLKIINVAINNNVRRVICVHTTGIFSKYRSASEEYIKIENKLKELNSQSKIKVIILRPTMIYGDLCDHNMSIFIKVIDKLRVVPLIDYGKCLIQPVNARDLGKAYYSVLIMPDNIAKSEYILSGEKPISMIDAFKLISNNLGKKTLFISFPLPIGVFIAHIVRIFSFGKKNFIEKVQRMSEDRIFSHDEATNDFGYNPEPFETGISREVKEYLSR